MKIEELQIGSLVEIDGITSKVDVSDFVEYSQHPNYINEFKPIPLSSNFLTEGQKFKIDDDGNYYKQYDTHVLELIAIGSFFYPVLVQIPELNSDGEQRVSLNSIEFVHELQNLISTLFKHNII